MSILTGKGFFTWKIPYCEGGNVQAIAGEAQAAGLTHVLIKVANGIYRYNAASDLPGLVAALHAVGIQAWGWQYIFGQSPALEAGVASRQAVDLGLDGFVVNAEMEFKAPGMSGPAITYMTLLRRALPYLPLALSSYRYPSLHREFPFHEFLTFCDFAMPQVYWEQAHNPGAQLERCLGEYQSLKPDMPVVPTGAAYKWNGWAATPGDVAEFLAQAKILVQGCNFWEWWFARQRLPELWPVIAEFAWPGSPPPPPPPPDQGLRMRVIASRLNVRTGPGTVYASIGSLSAGDHVVVQDIAGASAWVEIDYQGRRAWACVQGGASRYMEPAETPGGVEPG